MFAVNEQIKWSKQKCKVHVAVLHLATLIFVSLEVTLVLLWLLQTPIHLEKVTPPDSRPVSCWVKFSSLPVSSSANVIVISNIKWFHQMVWALSSDIEVTADFVLFLIKWRYQEAKLLHLIFFINKARDRICVCWTNCFKVLFNFIITAFYWIMYHSFFGTSAFVLM